jgi:signal transduction histidine kinase
LALLSHELRTPLTPALAAASYLAEHEDLLPEFREEVMAICSNVQLESRLIDDLLDLTRITRGKIELRRETVDAHRLLRDALEIARKDMEEKKIDLVMELDATFHHVWADPVRIQQVLWNLINNAVKFTNTGGRITVRTSSKKKRFSFEIADTGLGIEPEKQHSIFNAFDQGEPSITRQFGGLGLGLTISKRLLDLHGGAISVESKGKYMGSLFKVTLDAVRPAVPLPLMPTAIEPERREVCSF